MRRWTILMVLIIAVSMFAQQGQKTWMDKLDLSDTQKEKIEKLSNDWKKSEIDLKADVEKAQLSVKEVLSDEKATNADLEKAFDGMMDAKNALEKGQFNHMLKVRDELTDAQKAEFAPHIGGVMSGKGQPRMSMHGEMGCQKIQSGHGGSGSESGESQKKGCAEAQSGKGCSGHK